MRLFTEKKEHNFTTKGDDVVYEHNPKIDYVCFCECGGYGTRNQYGCDDYCPKCGKWLDWKNGEKW